MKNILFFHYFIFFIACKKSTGSSSNHAPLVSLSASILSVAPYAFQFEAASSDIDGDKLTYDWNFGDGSATPGKAEQEHSYNDVNKSYTVKVTVSDGKANTSASTTVNTTTTVVTIDAATKFQTMQGFGGFGAKDVYWSSGQFTSASFVSDIIGDLGLSILRDNIPTNFEDVNDDKDPHTTNLSNFHYGSFTDHIEYLKDMKSAGLQKLIVSCWSPPAWMKTNKNVNGPKADAPAYNPNPTSADNQLRTDMYDEFAERCVAYIKVVKQETGIDVYGISLQNEPRFSEPYESCVFSGDALRDLIKVVGKRFAEDGITAKIFMPEDVGYLDGVSSMVQPTLEDAVARNYVSIIAVHGYALDGVTANSPDAQTWKTMYSWGAQHNMPLWMTETSGFSNDMKGAMDLSKAMYTAITFGNVSAWLHWELSQQTMDEFSLMSSSGEKSKRYYVSKNFYHYVRPGDYRIKASANDGTNIHPVAFKNDVANTTTIVLINDNTTDVAVKLSGANLPVNFNKYVTSANDNCKDYGTVNAGAAVLLPAGSVTTLYQKN